MNTLYKIALPLVFLAVPAVMATDEIAADTDLKCTACHDKAGSRLLTDQGKYFETMGTLDGYDTISDAFGRCTKCHVRKPGSVKLTKTGKRFAEFLGSMEELREWLEELHPVAPDDRVQTPCRGDDDPPVALAVAH